jgi:uncharacterized protein
MPARYIKRALLSPISDNLTTNKVLIIYGARRVGKTELIKKFLATYRQEKYLLLNGEDHDAQQLLANQSISHYSRLLAGITLLVIDEAQHIHHIGKKLKLIVDEVPGIKVLVTGSSVFDLSNKLGEPLVGRKYTLQLHPIAQLELQADENPLQTKANLEERLIYGSYPELWRLTTLQQKQNYLKELVDSYLLKDILTYEGLRKADKIFDLLRLLAYQVGKMVSIHELANNLKDITRNTVEQYLDLLTKTFVIYPIGGYSSNLRKEITKSKRWYFYDNGVRNAIISNFNPINMRNDAGELWENYLATERIKYQHYTNKLTDNYFWRTYDRQEIDWVEHQQGTIQAYEFKWNQHKKVKTPTAWAKAYPAAKFHVITPDNYLGWITG